MQMTGSVSAERDSGPHVQPGPYREVFVPSSDSWASLLGADFSCVSPGPSRVLTQERPQPSWVLTQERPQLPGLGCVTVRLPCLSVLLRDLEGRAG